MYKRQDINEIKERFKNTNLITVGIKDKNDKISSVGEDLSLIHILWEKGLIVQGYLGRPL